MAVHECPHCKAVSTLVLVTFDAVGTTPVLVRERLCPCDLLRCVSCRAPQTNGGAVRCGACGHHLSVTPPSSPAP
jgi:hypothetical protein